MRFSIIIPVYNVEKYLGKCLESVAKQTFQDFEAIIVDDESPDNSMAVVEQYLQRYPEKFRVIHQKNKGLGGARNTGVQAALGEYLVFLDSDDYIDLNMLFILNQRVSENPCDMLIFNYLEVTENGTELPSPTACHVDTLACSEDEKTGMLLSPPAAWNKIYSRSFYQGCDVKFPEKLLYEDVITRILLLKANVVQLCTARLYYYVQRSNSIMHSKVSNRSLEIMQVVDNVYARLVDDGLYAIYKSVIDVSLICSVLAVVNSVHDQAWDHPIQKLLAEYIVNKFSDFRSNFLISKDQFSQIDLLYNGEFKENCLRSKRSQLKTKLLMLPWISSLNRMRKKIKSAVLKK